MNPAWFKKQGPDGQKLIRTALAAGKAYNLKEITNSINDAYKNVAANGMEVIEFSENERANWITALKSLYDGLDPEIKSMLKQIKK